MQTNEVGQGHILGESEMFYGIRPWKYMQFCSGYFFFAELTLKFDACVNLLPFQHRF